MSSKRLTVKQSAFVDEYLIDLNATQACIRCGYAPRTANRTATKLLSNAVIQKRIAQRMQERSERIKIDSDYVLQRLVAIDQMDIADIHNEDGSIKPVKDWPEIWREFISGIDVSEVFDGSGDQRKLSGVLKKIRWPDKLKNLELLGKHVGVQAWRERTTADIDESTRDFLGEILDAIDGTTKGLPCATKHWQLTNKPNEKRGKEL